VVRVFAILELFSALRRPLTGGQVAKALNYPGSSTFALLRSMTAQGYLAFDPLRRTYFPTVRLAHLNYWLHVLSGLRPTN
jgi:DNA-binding IclR family transcriptional regulator